MRGVGKGKKRRANGEGWINKRADRRYDVGLHLYTPDGHLKRKAATKKET